MESSTMVLMDPSAGKELGTWCRERTCRYGGKENVERMKAVASTYAPSCVEQTAGETLLCNTASAAWLSDDVEGWDGRARDDMGWSALLYGRDQHNIGEQLSSK